MPERKDPKVDPKETPTKRSQSAPEDYPRVNDAKRIVPPGEHVENVGQRRPDAESGDDVIVRHPADRENEMENARRNEADAEGEGYEWERSGAV